MPVEIVALIDKPWLLATVLAIGAACGIAVERISQRINRAERRAKWQRRQRKSADGRVTTRVTSFERMAMDAAEQLRIVMAADFQARPVSVRARGVIFGVE